MTTLFSPPGLFLVLQQAKSHFTIPWLLILSWLVFIPLLYSNYRQAFVVSSNMNWKYKKRFAYLLAIFIASVAVSFFSILWATVIVGVPAGLIILYCGLVLFALIFSKKPWH